MSAEELYSIKMRASKKENGTDVHISGAEKIVEAPDVDIFANALIERGMHHSKGEADALNLKINKVCKENIIYLDALSVETIEVETWEKGQEEIKKYLKETGIDNPQDVMQFLDETYVKEGAVVIDVGINAKPEGGGICGDVDTDDVVGKASMVTPVPAGVGSVTTSILAKHVIKACKQQNNK